MSVDQTALLVISNGGIVEHKLKTCRCEEPTCPVCQGLGICIVCGGAECELPTECPGEQMTQEQKVLVCSGDMDFYYDNWHDHSILYEDS